MLGFEGVPAFYLNAMFATRNDIEEVNKNSSNRAINRYKWKQNSLLKQELEKRLKSPNKIENLVLNSLKNLISKRKIQPAFHPNATQNRTFDAVYIAIGELFFWRLEAVN